MQLKNIPLLNEVKKNHLAFRFFKSGDIFDITYKDHQINLLRGNQIDGSLLNIYLRVYQEDHILSTPLIGKKSQSTFYLTDFGGVYVGQFEGVDYQLKLIIEANRWDYHIELSSQKEVTLDVIYGQDLALASQGSVLNSEPYTVQYIDYKAFKDQQGYTLCARQNQGKTSFFQMGSFEPNVAYATDGFQFFGRSYKKTGYPEVLHQALLPSSIYQYEFSYFALQSDKIHIHHQKKHVTFYGYYHHEDHEVIKKTYPITPLHIPAWKPEHGIKHHQHDRLLDPARQLNGKTFDEKEMTQFFPNMQHVEKDEHGLLSFFTDDYHHVILQEKEVLVERPHGHVLIHHDLLHVSENVMSSTNFMFGIFCMHLVLGNTSFNKFSGDLRNPLNLQKISGLRIYLRIDGVYHILGLPSYYELGATSSRWVYKLEDDIIEIDVFANIHHNVESLTFHSKNNIPYDLIMTQQVLMGVSEYQFDIEYMIVGNDLYFHAPRNAMFYHVYPDLTYKMAVHQPYEILNEEVAFDCQDQHGMLIQSFKQQTEIRIDFEATMTNQFDHHETMTYEDANQKGTDFFRSFTQLSLTHPVYQKELSRLLHIVFWYTHNALTHYASPHGLEQYNGAAWGTRDVCQGPIEFFTTTQRFDIVREILLKVYKRQFIENGDFPQWYMFDKYDQIQAHESHGDIIIWPLRSLAHYLESTKDFSILDEKLPYMSMKDNHFTEPEGLFEHVKKQVKAIKDSFVPGTSLPKYGGGDWDDTLQPANHSLTTKMVSGWTVALLYETLEKMAIELKPYHPAYAHELSLLKDDVKKDYDKHIIVDGIPAGFVVFEAHEKVLLLHPRDEKTGLKYRLLPFTRAMISEIAEHNQIKPYKKVIDDVFLHPDGVRLMDTAVAYHGGAKTYFSRAETAANFGREIGLQYVHAHIRYIEAMTKTGYADAAYKGLFTINPVGLSETVAHAYYRQSNVYFSSSDAWFKDRYEAKEQFMRIKTGDIAVKGGWRLYSSGPGIYVKQLISHVFGVRIEHQKLIIDPVLPKKLDGLIMNYHFLDRPIQITFIHGKKDIEMNTSEVIIERYQQKYRAGGYAIDFGHLKDSKQPIFIVVGFE